VDYRVNARRSLAGMERRIRKHIEPFFRGRRMSTITTADVQKYVEHRLGEGASAATINRETSAIGRAYTLCLRAGTLVTKPYIEKLKEAAPRSGFFEADQVEAVRRHLPAPLRGVLTFAVVTGWRIKSEVLPLEWRQVDFGGGGEVRLDANQTKNQT